MQETQETWVRSLGLEHLLDEGMATHSSILAWRILMDRGPCWATVHSIAKCWTLPKWLSTQHKELYKYKITWNNLISSEEDSEKNVGIPVQMECVGNYSSERPSSRVLSLLCIDSSDKFTRLRCSKPEVEGTELLWTDTSTAVKTPLTSPKPKKKMEKNL